MDKCLLFLNILQGPIDRTEAMMSLLHKGHKRKRTQSTGNEEIRKVNNECKKKRGTEKNAVTLSSGSKHSEEGSMNSGKCDQKTKYTKKSDIESSKCNKTLTKSEQNKLYYEKNKEKIKEKRMKRYKDDRRDNVKIATEKDNIGQKCSIVTATCIPKLSRSERNRLYYNKNKDKIKGTRMKDYNDPLKRKIKLQSAKEAYMDPDKRAAKLAAMKKYYNDKNNHAALLSKRKKEYSVPEKHTAKLAAMKESYKNPVKRASKLAAMRESYKDPVKHASKLAAMKVCYSDPVKHAAILMKRKLAYNIPAKHSAKLVARKQRYKNPVKRAEELARNRILYRKEQAKRQTLRNNRNSDYDFLLNQARKAMLELPVLACTVCHRARFKEQVKLCHRNKYPQTHLVLQCFTGKYVHKCSTGCNDTSVYHDKKKKEWICFTCHRHLLKGNMPPQAAVNNLWLDDMPEELKILNALEMHLVSIVQPFMKIVPLPRGSQKGIRGQMVCVPANLQRTADSLPWTLNTNNLIRVKLKRKQEYKGHHLYMVVSQKRVMAALKKLMEINPAYKGEHIFYENLVMHINY